MENNKIVQFALRVRLFVNNTVYKLNVDKRLYVNTYKN